MQLPSDFFAGLKLALLGLPFAVGGFYLVLAGHDVIGGLLAVVGILAVLTGFVLHVAIVVDRIRAASRRRDDS